MWAQVIEINIEKAFPDADYFVMEKAGAALPWIVSEIKKIYESGAWNSSPQRHKEHKVRYKPE